MEEVEEGSHNERLEVVAEGGGEGSEGLTGTQGSASGRERGSSSSGGQKPR